ncbi:MAG TPA: AAA family ATPase [Puia sp.]|nr:AAA family ATPase [Puia sp.]
MNPIKNIEIKNFKSIRHQTIDDCKRINVFIGYPNVGKSNILEALSLFGLNQQTPITDLIRLKEDPTIFFNGYIQNLITVTLNNKYRILGEYLSDFLRLVFQTNDSSDFFRNDTERRNPSFVLNTIEYKNFKLSRTTSNIPQNTTSIADDFVIKKYEFKKSSEVLPKGYSSLEYPFGGNVFAILQTNKKLNENARELFLNYDLDFVYDSRIQQFTILKKTDLGVFTVPYELVADTLQRLIFHKAAILSNQERILLFEEPEAHMFPPYIRKFTTDVIFDKTNQFFITTHSPYVLDELILEAENELSVYLVDYKDGETKIHHLSPDDLKEVREYGVDLFFNIESYLKHGQVNNA